MTSLNRPRFTALFGLATLLAATLGFVRAEPYLVENGVAHAEIIVSEAPTRTQRLAARELQTYLEKISGAQLEVRSSPSGDLPVKLYVGTSAYTEALGITAGGLQYGAYRVVSGDDWMVFIGDDSDFVPIEPWPRNNNDLSSGKMQEAWNEVTGENWGFPHRQLYKHYSGPNALFGTPNEVKADEEGNVHIWTFDERGSFNAVCGYLRSLGVRWYMPGELGEVLPSMPSIPLPEIDETTHPDFAMRTFQFRPSGDGREAMMWGFRLGVRRPYGRQAAHGFRDMTDNEATMRDHPEWFALYGGERQNRPEIKNNQLCYSNEELFRETVRFAQVQFDHYDMDVVSMMPPDGYTSICQCELLRGQGISRARSPRQALQSCLGLRQSSGERNRQIPSRKEGFQLRLRQLHRATERYRKTRTERPGDYRRGSPPQGSRSGEHPPPPRGLGQEDGQPDRDFRELSLHRPQLVSPRLQRARHRRRHRRDQRHLPRRRCLAVDGLQRSSAVGLNHFLIYFYGPHVLGRVRTRDVRDTLWTSTSKKFYGPAESSMRDFFIYCEETLVCDGATTPRKHAARLGIFSPIAKEFRPTRIRLRSAALLSSTTFLSDCAPVSAVLSQKRGPVAKVRKVGGDPVPPIVVDGKLGRPALAKDPDLIDWQVPREPDRRAAQISATTFMVEWRNRTLYFAIRCEEKTGVEPLNIATRKNEDRAHMGWGRASKFFSRRIGIVTIRLPSIRQAL